MRNAPSIWLKPPPGSGIAKTTEVQNIHTYAYNVHVYNVYQSSSTRNLHVNVDRYSARSTCGFSKSAACAGSASAAASRSASEEPGRGGGSGIEASATRGAPPPPEELEPEFEPAAAVEVEVEEKVEGSVAVAARPNIARSCSCSETSCEYCGRLREEEEAEVCLAVSMLRKSRCSTPIESITSRDRWRSLPPSECDGREMPANSARAAEASACALELACSCSKRFELCGCCCCEGFECCGRERRSGVGLWLGERDREWDEAEEGEGEGERRREDPP